MGRAVRRRGVAGVTGLGVVVVVTAAVVGTHLFGTHPSTTGATGRPAEVATRHASHPAQPSGAPTATATTTPTPRTTDPKPLAGRIVVLDPGHDGGNAAAASTIDRTVWNGRETEACDTTGTATNDGYPESRFNFAVAMLARADLEAEGAKVALTRTDDTGVGPCITQRTAIGNQAHADAVVSIHADGGPAYGRGYTLLLPVADGANAGVIGPSTTLGIDLRNAFLPATGMPISNYDGIYGLQSRDDLAGTNLTTVPKVFIECGNMRNATDAALLISPAWQMQAAQGIATGLENFVLGAHS
jgi:N-acetylmuramoyl-L-alanine amidase